MATHRKIGPTVLKQANQAVSVIVYSPDGKYVAVGGNGGTLSLWDRRTGRAAGPRMRFAYPVSGVAFSRDSRVMFTATTQVQRFDVATQRRIGKPFAIGDAISGMAVSSGGDTVAVITDPGVTLWDVASGRQLGTEINTGVGSLNSLAFSPDGRILAVAGQDGAIRLWDVVSREQIGSPLVVNQNGVGGLAFSPDGSMLAADNGNAVRLWGVVPTRDIVQRVCTLAGGSMSRQRWAATVKSAPYQRTCPSRPARASAHGSTTRPLPTTVMPAADTVNPRSASRSRSTPTEAPAHTTTFLSRIAFCTTARDSTRTLLSSTERSTQAQPSTRTPGDSTDSRTSPPDTMTPLLTRM